MLPISPARANQDVPGPERRQLRLGVEREEEVRELLGDVQRIVEFIALVEPAAHVDDDEHFGLHVARDAYRDIVRKTAVDQEPAVDLDRIKAAGTAMLARMDLARLPEDSTTSLPVSMSVATAR